MFNILNHVDRFEFENETNTQLTVKCPICSRHIRINKRNGAYFCINGCDTKSIRQAVNLSNSIFSNISRTVYCPPVEIEFSDIISIHSFDQKVNIEEHKMFSGLHGQQIIKTEYYYSDTFKVERNDLLVDKKKEFFPKTLVNGVWVCKNTDNPCLYNSKFIKDYKLVLFVEGEKCAHLLSDNTNLLTLTCSSYDWNEIKLREQLLQIKHSIAGIIYLPDNDKVGFKKARLVQHSAWYVGIPCKVITLSHYFKNDGDDVIDLIKEGLDVKTIIKSLIGELLYE